MKRILITGGCGFIGSNLVNYLIKNPNLFIVNLDKIDYCSSLENLDIPPECLNRYVLIPGNCCDIDLVSNILTIYKIDVILHLAAQSHVDNSFGNSLSFTKDNIMGTHTLLECAKIYNKLHRFIFMSTDEVHGDSTLKSDQSLNPTNPYAATKASCELLVGSYAKSFKLPTIIVRSNNVFGPRQHKEKLIPRFIDLLIKKKKLTIQGSGMQKRTFVHVNDVCQALEMVMNKGELYEIYEIGSHNEYTVLEIGAILLNRLKGKNEKLENYLEYIQDRDFNDFRYHVNTYKLETLGWVPPKNFMEDLNKTVDWYLKHHYTPDLVD